MKVKPRYTFPCRSKGSFTGFNLPKGERSHERCIAATGVARPGKTAHDKASGAWKPKSVRRQAQIDRHNAIKESGARRG